MAETEKKAPEKSEMVSREEYENLQKAYSNLADAFNKLLKEFNDLHVASLFKKD